MSTQTPATGSAKENQSSVLAKMRIGRCSVAVLQKDDKSRPFAVVERSYEKDGKWQSDSFALPVDDLANLSAAAYEMYIAVKAK